MINERESNFFNSRTITTYKKPIFDDVDERLIRHYEENREAIHSLRRDMVYLPENIKMKVEFLKRDVIDLWARYYRKTTFNTHFEYLEEKIRKQLEDIGIPAEQLDLIKSKTIKAKCIGFAKEDSLKIGVEKSKAGMFYYRFNAEGDPPNLQDSCMIMKIKDEVYLEYDGSGRGPDCLIYNYPDSFDDRNILEKWRDLIRYRKVVYK